MKKQNILLLSFLFLLQNAIGQSLFTPIHHTIQKTATYEYSVAGDLDGDGTDELVVFENPLNQINAIHIFDVTTDGDFSLLQTIDLNPFLGEPILVDADNDGDLDIVYFDYSFEILFHENLGNLNFATTNTIFYNSINTSNGPIRGFHFFDFDSDGDLDYILSFDDGPQLFENENGSYSFYQALDINNATAQKFYPIDLDGDNDLDLVVQTGAIRFSYNENGVFTDPEIVMYIPSSNTSFFDFGDIDSDGDIDIGYVEFNSNFFTLALNDGTDTVFTDLESYEFPHITQASDIEFIDLDNDNDLDVLVGDKYQGVPDGESSRWLQNMGDTLILRFPPKPSFLTYSEWTHFAPMEIDGDAGQEFAAVSGHQASNRIYSLEYDDLQDSILLKKTYQNIANQFLDVKIGDLDADGKEDISTFNFASKNITWFKNQFPNENISPEVIISNAGLVNNSLVSKELIDLNGDGHLDIIYTEKITIFNDSGSTYIIYNFPLGNGFSDTILISDIPLKGFRVFDADEDGDLDILCSDDDNYVLLKNIDNAGSYEPPVVVFTNYYYSLLNSYQAADLDGDNDNDLVFYSEPDNSLISVRELVVLKNNGNANYSDPIQLDSFPSLYDLRNLKIVDMNGDGFLDIIYHIRKFSTSTGEHEVRILYNINGSGEFSAPNTIYHTQGNFFGTDSFFPTDIDLDGDMDLIERSDQGVTWYQNLDNSGEFSYSSFAPPIDETFNHSSLTGLADMDEDGDLDFIFNGKYLLYWAENTTIHPYWLEGDLVADTILNCTIDAAEPLINDWIVIAEQFPYQIAMATDSSGHYKMPVDSGEWIISAIPRSDYWTPCFEDSLVIMPAVGDTIVTNFFMQPNGDCGFLDWEITDNGRFRLCETNTSSIEICNYGIETLENLQLQVAIDSLLTFENSSHPFTMISIDSILIEIGTLAFNECETITLDVFTPCDSVALFTAPCINYSVLPNDLCAPSDSLWDGSIITVDGFCANDSIYFTLQNIGTSAMSMPAQHRVQIINDDIVMLFEVDDYQLGVLEIKELSYPTLGLGLRLAADQSANNPVAEEASVIVPNCDDLANNIVLNWMPTENGNPFTESTCNPFFGSYDPNDKRAIPTGIGMENNIQRNWELDYNIRFQNTGNDTAFLVVLRDTISEHLDLATLNVRSGSHQYSYEINPERELKITFANIQLPDSTTNLDESQGYLEYSISPKSDVPFGSLIENTAYIYFDYNAPIITNTVFHTIQKPVVSTIEHLQVCQDDVYVMDTVLMTETIFTEYDSVHLVYVDVIPTIEIDISEQVEIGTIYEGEVINSDTSFTQIFMAQNGCDSLVNYTVSIFTNTISPDFQKVKVFPNPVAEQLNIIGNENRERQNWKLVNSSGMIVWEKSLEKNEAMKTIFLENFPIGVYWLEVKSERGFGVWKIVKME